MAESVPPNFLVIGAPRSGTTSLYQYLSQHPDVFMCDRKEPRFFAFEGRKVAYKGPADEQTINKDPVTDRDTYVSLYEDREDETAIGETSPLYLFDEQAPSRIHRYVPDAQFFAVLRNPVERAYSDFLNMVRLGREPLRDFQEAIGQEPHRIEANWGPFYHYVRKGFYNEHLARYEEFFECEQMHVHLFEDLVEDPSGLMRQIFDTLGVEANVDLDVSRSWNPSGMPRSETLQRVIRSTPVRTLNRKAPEGVSRSLRRVEDWNLEKPEMPPATRDHLVDVYEEDIHGLEKRLGRDLTHWT